MHPLFVRKKKQRCQYDAFYSLAYSDGLMDKWTVIINIDMN